MVEFWRNTNSRRIPFFLSLLSFIPFISFIPAGFMHLRFCFTALLIALFPLTAQSQTRAAEPTDGTILAQEGGIRLSFPKGWKPTGKETVSGTAFFVYAKTFTGDDGPENVRVSMSVSKGGSFEKAVIVSAQHFFPAKTQYGRNGRIWYRHERCR